MLKLLIQRSEIGAGTRGSSLGADALKMAAINKQSRFFKDYPIEIVADRNELLMVDNVYPNAIRIDGIHDVYSAQCQSVSNVLINGHFPFVISADHASAGGTIAGLANAFPDKRIGVIWVDAHADLHSPYTTPSGNVHGMPLAYALGEENMERQINTPTDGTLEHWTKMKELGGRVEKIQPSDLVFIGVRDTEEPEEHLMKTLDILNIEVSEVRESGAEASATKAINHLSHCDLIYVSFDVDSMDPDMVSYGTGTPVKNGLLPEEAKEIIHLLVQDSRLACFEVVEVNPLLDNKGNAMAEATLDIIESAAQIIASK
ncbi:MAG: arginase [Salibacteraceae bacterium]